MARQNKRFDKEENVRDEFNSAVGIEHRNKFSRPLKPLTSISGFNLFFASVILIIPIVIILAFVFSLFR